MRIFPICGQRHDFHGAIGNRRGLKRSNDLEGSKARGCAIPVEDRSRPSVDLISREADFSLIYRAEVSSFPEVLAEHHSSRPLAFSFEARCQGLAGSQK